jgi:Mce-associated membrane protein
VTTPPGDDPRYDDPAADPEDQQSWDEAEELSSSDEPTAAADPEPAAPAEDAEPVGVVYEGQYTPLADDTADDMADDDLFTEQPDELPTVEPVYDDAVYDDVYPETVQPEPEDADEPGLGEGLAHEEPAAEVASWEEPFDTAPPVVRVDDEPAHEAIGSEQDLPEEALPEDTLPEDTLPEEASPEEVSADDLTGGLEASADESAADELAADDEAEDGGYADGWLDEDEADGEEPPAEADRWEEEGELDPAWAAEDAEDSEGLAPEEDADLAPTADSGRRLVTALAVLVAALLLLGGYLGYEVADSRGPAPIEATRSSALDAGRDAARVIFSYDYRHLQKDFDAAAAVATGSFKKDYENTTKKLVSDVAPRYKAVLVAEVSEAGVIRAGKDEVQLLVFMDVQSTSTLAATPKVTPRRLKMTMTRSGDRWLVSKVDAF